MRLRSAAVAIVVLAVTRVLAQGTPPAGTSLTRQRSAPVARRGMALDSGKATAAQTPAELHQRMEDMQSTLAKMHAVLKQMRAKAVKGGAKDSLTTANLDMWELMLGHLDKQFEELRTTTLAREDMEARRVAMYKQAEERAAAARKMQEASASAKTGQGATSGTQAPTSAGPAATPTAPAAPAPAASSPN